MGILLSSQIAQKITGIPIAQFVEAKIFKPLGMTAAILRPGRAGRSRHRCPARLRPR